MINRCSPVNILVHQTRLFWQKLDWKLILVKKSKKLFWVGFFFSWKHQYFFPWPKQSPEESILCLNYIHMVTRWRLSLPCTHMNPPTLIWVDSRNSSIWIWVHYHWDPISLLAMVNSWLHCSSGKLPTKIGKMSTRTVW